jgi:hypothetical protein
VARVSQHYSLGRTQGSLEFVDVDVDNDVALFIDPGAIRLLGTTMSQECASLLQNFFQTVLAAIRAGNDDDAKDLLATLNELNETRLGYSAAGSAGRGMGRELATAVHGRLSASRAVQTGLLNDLEETALFVPGIDRDIISDIVTNIVYGPLVAFTQTMCAKYSIPTLPGIAYYRWDRRGTWAADQADLPVAANKPLVLVPRSFVRRRRNVLNAAGYYDHHVLPYLQQRHLDANTELVRVLKSGERRAPSKKTLREQHPDVKGTNTEITAADPGLLRAYREDAERRFDPIGHTDLGQATGAGPPDFDGLLAEVLACTPGAADATRYQHAVERLLTALLYPALDNPVLEQRIHHGRKRIDIDYTNIATRGFFHWLHAVFGVNASYVPVECKNYTEDPANPEFDQLAGRFSIQRGHVGLLCFRSSADKDLIVQRCADAAVSGRGYMLPLDDEDLKALVDERKQLADGQDFRFLHDRFKQITS